MRIEADKRVGRSVLESSVGVVETLIQTEWAYTSQCGALCVIY